MSKLVIVESPAKAKTIKKYLGSDFDVVASMGHVRDLPENRLSVDVKHDFKPKYEVIKGKEKLVEELKEAANKSDEIFLATDPDRERRVTWISIISPSMGTYWWRSPRESKASVVTI